MHDGRIKEKKEKAETDRNKGRNKKRDGEIERTDGGEKNQEHEQQAALGSEKNRSRKLPCSVSLGGSRKIDRTGRERRDWRGK
ncbi:hypothetical protein ACFX19_013398 [Malus domestica]